jgi:uncharacterized protein (AIM24 family)
MNAPAYTCLFCRQPSDPNARSCPNCGAPVDIRAAVSASGWTKQPAIRDMARIQFGQSRCQIEGTLLPAADFALAQGDWIYFSHHNLLWADPSAQLDRMSLKGAWKRMMGGLPLVMMTGRGPGNIALAGTHAGDIVVLPLAHNQRMWVHEHRFLGASGNIFYDWANNNVWFVTGSGDDRKTHYPLGMFGDIFTAQGGPGLLLLHSPGNTFIRDLAPGQSLLVKPSALLYRDLSVTAHLHLEYPHTRGLGWWRSFSYRSIWLRLVGPGRVAVQSVYVPEEESEAIRSHSQATVRRW